jgi:hypothetical protein
MSCTTAYVGLLKIAIRRRFLFVGDSFLVWGPILVGFSCVVLYGTCVGANFRCLALSLGCQRGR